MRSPSDPVSSKTLSILFLYLGPNSIMAGTEVLNPLPTVIMSRVLLELFSTTLIGTVIKLGFKLTSILDLFLDENSTGSFWGDLPWS